MLSLLWATRVGYELGPSTGCVGSGRVGSGQRFTVCGSASWIAEFYQTVPFQRRRFKQRETRRDSITICGRKLGKPWRISIIRFLGDRNSRGGGKTADRPIAIQCSRRLGRIGKQCVRSDHSPYSTAVTKLSRRIVEPTPRPLPSTGP